MEIVEINNNNAQFAGNGYWNDPDMLVTGEQGLSLDEQQSHFALWCMMSSPLILGNDPRSMSKEEKAIIMNERAISIGQDPTEQGKRIKRDGDIEVWLKNLINRQKAVLILNRNRNKTIKYTFNLKDLGITGKRSMTDVYSGSKIQAIKEKIKFKIKPHTSSFFKIE